MHLTKQLGLALTILDIFSWLCAADKSGNKQPQLPTCSSTTTKLTPRYFGDQGSERIKVTYGPFTAPSSSEDHGMADFTCAPPLHCTNCTITFMQAGLEYSDGTPATVDRGMLLHHVVFQNLNRIDPMCPKQASERFFASGDERTPIDLTMGGTTQFGYSLGQDEVIAFGLEIMNMQKQERHVLLTITWEYVPSSEGFQAVTPYWFDIGGCGPSEMPAKEKAIFNYSSPTVNAPTSGLIAMTGSHLHDGGTHLELLRNGKTICVGDAAYSNEHISQMSTCKGLAYRQGDEFEITAHYNTKKHKPMKHADGGLEPIMGIALVYAVQNYADIRHGNNMGRFAFAAFLGVVLVAALGFTLWRFQRKQERNVVPAWLRQRVPGYRSVELGGDGNGSEERLLSNNHNAHVISD